MQLSMLHRPLLTELVGRSAKRQVQNAGSDAFKEARRRSPQHIGENPCECSERGKACRYSSARARPQSEDSRRRGRNGCEQKFSWGFLLN